VPASPPSCPHDTRPVSDAATGLSGAIAIAPLLPLMGGAPSRAEEEAMVTDPGELSNDEIEAYLRG